MATEDSQHQVEAGAQVSGRKLTPWKGTSKSAEHYCFTPLNFTLPLIHLDDTAILAWQGHGKRFLSG